MRADTAAAKMAELLGLSKDLIPDELKSKSAKRKAAIKKKKDSSIVGVTEQEIQKFREAQGIQYFLQAPALFDSKVCKHCGERFLVSRKYVAFCSYTCIKADLETRGIVWTKDGDLEALANDPQVYQGNEPIWIRDVDKLKEALLVLTKESVNA